MRLILFLLLSSFNRRRATTTKAHLTSSSTHRRTSLSSVSLLSAIEETRISYNAISDDNFHLSYDLLRLIMLSVVASDGGATYLARAIATCKDFYKFRDDEEILKVANFDKFSLPKSVFHFQQLDGLLVKCAQAGNSGARYVLAQVLLVSFSQIRESMLFSMGQASTRIDVEQNSRSGFFFYFIIRGPMGSNSNGFNHYDLVWYFVRKCSLLEFVSMLPHVKVYVKFFGTFPNQIGKVSKLFDKFSYMLAVIGAVIDVGKQRRTGQLEANMRDPQAVVDRITEMHTYHLARRANELSLERWEELKRECKYMKEELSIIINSEEAADSASGVPDMEERFFYYVGFDEPVTQEIDLRSDPDLRYLWSECRDLAISYEINRCEAISAFGEIFSVVLI